MNNACLVLTHATIAIKVLSILVCVYGALSVIGLFVWLFGDDYYITENAKKWSIIASILFVSHLVVFIVSPSMNVMGSLVGVLCKA